MKISDTVCSTMFAFYVMICPIRVSCHAVADMCEQLKCPQALILEAPFNNLKEEVKLNPLSQVRY